MILSCQEPIITLVKTQAHKKKVVTIDEQM